ncbi:MAG: class I SAM-dependent methyltransferase [Intrasporangiaceae bacterium]|nr:class I SAM-dependent methyltransferase [Intrasporangiaceae bacterium]
MDTDVPEEIQRLFASEEGARATARARAVEPVHPPSPEVGSLLRWAAITCGARTAVEVGGAGGVSGLWLIDGLGSGGVLTSIEPDPHAHGLATTAYADAEVGTRVRAILGQPEQVLPRLSDGAYDLMLLQSGPAGYVDALAHARRLLRPGGLLVARGILRPGDHAETVARFLDDLADDDRMTASLLALDGGLIIATRGEDADPDAVS